jgi:hypothetical protein
VFAKRHDARRVVEPGLVTHRVADAPDAGWSSTSRVGGITPASQLLADGFDRQYTATCLGYGDGGNVL